MFRIPSEAALRATFRPRDQQSLVMPEASSFPQFVRHYWAWGDPSGVWIWLVFQVRGGVPTGIAFRKSANVAGGQMCHWCHTFGPSGGVSLLTTDRNSRKRVGVLVCADLGCQTRVEDAALRAGKSLLDETEALMQRIGRFASEGLGIDLSGVGRNPSHP